MRQAGRFLTALFALMALLAPLPASAYSESGSHGWSTAPLTLHAGPGAAYDVTGAIPADVAIKVLRCQRLWCNVDGPGGRGWTSKDHIAFGKTSADWPGGINPDYPAGGPGQICFYTGTHYTGTALCAGTGRVFRDLALIHADNTFSSVRIEGNVSAAACRDRFFQSYCERIIESQPVLHQYLRDNLSSVRVY